ncbi:hypothetical protein N7495_008619 [Penicillium taxi]|uniref:uncharacterized protein n=1 Tax=Penicillium taxi TaxID=168475 RepID=UPI002545B531|nr:uncharacterized protein N7495_008619 [Penicillium taxi]KAJ5888578.1 hypothetical protein N7495_008619 [Penicillium taxi]
MGIPGLKNAIGKGERISLSKLAVSHLERTAKPIRVAVDISIWLFQLQAGRGGKNPELRTLYRRLVKLLALPVHPLFVYDGRQKPPFKRGKAVSPRSSGNAPIIRHSKDLIECFQFPWHEAPGEAEAECARLQQVGIVDAVMSDDVDTLMFGSKMTLMEFSKEPGSKSKAKTHVTCYRVGNEGQDSNVSLSRPGMILFAMLSGGDYLPNGVPKCGHKLAAEIAKAQFGDDLLADLSRSSDPDTAVNEWRERLQYELEENINGHFSTKHKAVRIPDTFPDRTIFEYYANPKVSNEDEMAALRSRLISSWDREIDPMAIRRFAADKFGWNYQSGARTVIKHLAEPLFCYRLRLQMPVRSLSCLSQSLAPSCDTPWLQKVYRSRESFDTDGTTEIQLDMLPIDVVGIDMLAEDKTPEIVPSQSNLLEEDEEEDPEVGAEAIPSSPSKSRVTKGYDVFGIEKVWVFKSVAKMGVPNIVKKWDDEEAAKAEAKKAPKKTASRRTGLKKKGPIDSGMKHGSILKYGTLTKQKYGLSSSNKTHMLEAAAPSAPNEKLPRTSSSNPEYIDLEDNVNSPSMYSQSRDSMPFHHTSREVDELVGTFSSLSTGPSPSRVKRHPIVGAEVLATKESDGILLSYSVSKHVTPVIESDSLRRRQAAPSSTLKKHNICNSKKSPETKHTTDRLHDVEELEKAITALSLSFDDDDYHVIPSARALQQPTSSTESESESGVYKYSSRTPKSKSLLSSETLSSMDDTISADPLQHRDELIHPSNQPLQKDLKKPKARSCSSQTSTPESIPAKDHIENITTCNGFWTVDASDEATVDSKTETTGYCEKGKEKKKRIPRVSFLDMI